MRPRQSAREPTARGQGEDFREELAQLKVQRAAQRREAAQLRDDLHAGEARGIQQDKQLWELLERSRCGAGVSAVALDRLRNDVQALLHLKRAAQEARRLAAEREQSILALRQKLKGADVAKMRNDVLRVKARAKERAAAWTGADDGGSDAAEGGHDCGSSRRLLQEAQDLTEKLTEVESEVSRLSQRTTTLRDEASLLERTETDDSEQLRKIRAKHAESELQKEEIERSIKELDGDGRLEERHRELRWKCDELSKQVSQVRQQEMVGQVQRSMDSTRELDSSSSALGVRLLVASADAETEALWQQFLVAIETSNLSALEVLSAADADGDGLLAADELARAFLRLRLPGGDPAAVRRLVGELGDAVVLSNGLISIARLAHMLPSRSAPAGPGDEELRALGEALAWQCRRRGVSERELRGRLASWSAHPGADFVALASELCAELGLGPSLAATLGEGLEAQREQIAASLPSWRCTSSEGRASALVRLVRDLAPHADALAPLLACAHVRLEDFLRVAARLGSTWSADDLEEAALAAEAANMYGTAIIGAAPVVDGERLLRAVKQGGLLREFPTAARSCHPRLLESCEAAVAAARSWG